MKYFIVTWVLSVMAAETSHFDEFGRINTTSYAVVHYTSEVHTKEFLSKDSAFAFYNRCIENNFPSTIDSLIK